jgi:hypothetical protein
LIAHADRHIAEPVLIYQFHPYQKSPKSAQGFHPETVRAVWLNPRRGR